MTISNETTPLELLTDQLDDCALVVQRATERYLVAQQTLRVAETNTDSAHRRYLLVLGNIASILTDPENQLEESEKLQYLTRIVNRSANPYWKSELQTAGWYGTKLVPGEHILLPDATTGQSRVFTITEAPDGQSTPRPRVIRVSDVKAGELPLQLAYDIWARRANNQPKPVTAAYKENPVGTQAIQTHLDAIYQKLSPHVRCYITKAEAATLTALKENYEALGLVGKAIACEQQLQRAQSL